MGQVGEVSYLEVEGLEAFNCPVCLALPEKDAYLCVLGHHICGSCCAELSQCPQCRTPYKKGKVRNLPLEQHLDSLTFPCKYAPGGCKVKLPRSGMMKHVRSCEFRPGTFVKFCHKYLHLDCNFVMDSRNPQAAVEHLMTCHDACQDDMAFFKFLIVGPSVAADMRNYSLAPSIVKVGPAEDSSFIVINIVYTPDTVWVGGLYLGSNPDLADKYMLRVFIEHQTKLDSSWSKTSSILHMDQLGQDIVFTQYSFSTVQLVKHAAKREVRGGQGIVEILCTLEEQQ